jgi:hypothetical protein
MVSAVGIEPAGQRKFNNMQGHGWRNSICKALVNPLTDRKRIAGKTYVLPRLAAFGPRERFDRVAVVPLLFSRNGMAFPDTSSKMPVYTVPFLKTGFCVSST